MVQVIQGNRQNQVVERTHVEPLIAQAIDPLVDLLLQKSDPKGAAGMPSILFEGQDTNLFGVVNLVALRCESAQVRPDHIIYTLFVSNDPWIAKFCEAVKLSGIAIGSQNDLAILLNPTDFAQHSPGTGTQDSLPIEPSCWRGVAFALTEAIADGYTKPDVSHVLLGMLMVPSVAADVLTKLGLDYYTVNEIVEALKRSRG